jgi:4-diphosphocytidyl-2-C-methyl-D-erythritol kinase
MGYTPAIMFMREPDLVVRAPAKVNLTLEILGLRPDGYHELRSILMPIGVCDDLAFWRTDDGRVETVVEAEAGVSLEAMGDPEKNLATRMARLLQSEFHIEQGVRIRIRKRIPVGGGLGGGSADAAGTLVGINALWRLGLTHRAMLELGARLGSDIPALVHGGAVVMEGRGERISPMDLPDGGSGCRFWLVVANPGIVCPTAEIYRLHNGSLTIRPDFFHNTLLSIRAGDVSAASRYLYNGLQPVVFKHFPATQDLAMRLRAAGALGVLVSGSGASVFALVRDQAHGDAVRERLGCGFWSVVTTTLPDGVMAAHGPLEP